MAELDAAILTGLLFGSVVIQRSRTLRMLSTLPPFVCGKRWRRIATAKRRALRTRLTSAFTRQSLIPRDNCRYG